MFSSNIWISFETIRNKTGLAGVYVLVGYFIYFEFGVFRAHFPFYVICRRALERIAGVGGGGGGGKG